MYCLFTKDLTILDGENGKENNKEVFMVKMTIVDFLKEDKQQEVSEEAYEKEK